MQICDWKLQDNTKISGFYSVFYYDFWIIVGEIFFLHILRSIMCAITVDQLCFYNQPVTIAHAKLFMSISTLAYRKKWYRMLLILLSDIVFFLRAVRGFGEWFPRHVIPLDALRVLVHTRVHTHARRDPYAIPCAWGVTKSGILISPLILSSILISVSSMLHANLA